jgi:site-specific recombinase XerD
MDMSTENKNGTKNVAEAIHTFLERKAQNSKNTADTYRRAIKHFFMDMREKELSDLTEADLVFTPQEIETYQVKLRKTLKTASVNTKLYALKSLYEKLQAYKFDVDAAWFDVEFYDIHDDKPSDPMEHNEVVEAIRLVLKTRQGKQKALLLRLAYATAFRKESLLEMRKTDVYDR